MRKTLLIGMSLAAVSLAAQADVLQMPEQAPVAAAAPAALPAKGSSKTEVLRQFGEPAVKHPAKGGGSPKHPPITRWDYPGFSVFFEHSHVVDVVMPDAPAPIHNKEELKTN